MKFVFLLLLLCCRTTYAAIPPMTKEQLQVFHELALDLHEYVSDEEQYHVEDYWAASLKGDCEDYALWIQAVLLRRGQASQLWYVRLSTKEYHMVLRVGDWIVDSRERKLVAVCQHDYMWVGGYYEIVAGQQVFHPFIGDKSICP